MGKEDEIRLIAYTSWEEEGCRDGCDVEYWLRAEAIWEEKQRKTPVSATKASPRRRLANQVNKKRTLKKR